MSMLDKIKEMLKGHESQTRQGVEKAGDYVDRKTGNRYESQVDMAQRKLDEQFGTEGEDRPRQS
jgi:hypothetical protein